MTSTELMKEGEEIYKKLKIPWTPEGMQTISGDKCIDSEKANRESVHTAKADYPGADSAK